MTDPHVSPPPGRIVGGERASICLPVVDLERAPGGPRDRQLLFGDAIAVLDRSATHCRVRSAKDGYCGWIPVSAAGPEKVPTHKVTVRSSHAYAAPDIKSHDRVALPFGALLTAFSETATFVETDVGFVPRQHLHRADALAEDPAAVAELFIGTPYLWGGNSHLGIDCSGLVQAACLACGIACPGDTDQQVEAVGEALSDSATLHRNDLLFWRGHVALVIDDGTLIHANAGHMATVHEPIKAAVERIARQGGGLPTRMRRLPAP